MSVVRKHWSATSATPLISWASVSAQACARCAPGNDTLRSAPLSR
jgi:hypothetical protein